MQQVSKIPVFGDRGVDVQVLQQSLNRTKVAGKLLVDGDFGIDTLDAVRAYQAFAGLAATGIPGRETMAALGIHMLDDEEKIAPASAPSVKFTRETIASKIVAIISADVAAKLRETQGKNRSPRIDSFNRRVGVDLGSPYCASGAWCAIDDACKSLGIKNPVKHTASSQEFRRSSFVPSKYLRAEGRLGKIGDFAVLQVPGEPAQGHLAVLRSDQKSQPVFETVEYNTNGSGSRDGDGAYSRTRSTKDGDKQNSSKLFIGFADIPQWVLDANS